VRLIVSASPFIVTIALACGCGSHATSEPSPRAADQATRRAPPTARGQRTLQRDAVVDLVVKRVGAR
jgi:hypothetical protein